MMKALAEACMRLLWILTLATCRKIPDAYVTCLFLEDCLLPCSFKPSGVSDIIHWYRQDVPVLSYPSGDNGTRMYLPKDLVSQGNASLHLRHCGIKDRGRYRCLVNTTQGELESYVILKVEAPIKVVTMEISQEDREILCLSTDIFPAPRVQWSTLPASGSLRFTTHMAASSDGLYSLQSKMPMLGDNLTYVCIVNSTYGSQSWRSSLRERGLSGDEGQNLLIPCMAPQNLQMFSLTWTFTRTNEPAVLILSYDDRTRETSNLWEGRARLEHGPFLRGDGSLLLLHPESAEHTGVYTCTFSGLQNRHVLQTNVTISTTQLPHLTRTGESQSSLWAIAVVIAAVALITAAFLIYRRHRKEAKQWRTGETGADDTEMQPMGTVGC